ncbi:MAG: hypothetical protein JXA92_13815 [candidate division Zixibacteria bacterium]|nr:hypothetical protein [candidate division Zixibacteria bacterium]
MKIVTEKKNMPFNIKDCTLITRMAGIDTAMNLRELRERLKICPIESLFHHFCETVIRPTFDDPEFRNDFAIWAAHNLRDRILAERLGILNPYALDNFEELRLQVLDIIDERLSQLVYFPWSPRGEEFQFMQAVTVVFETGIQLKNPEDLIRKLPQMSLSSIYYHFVEARRRTPHKTDDFTTWLMDYGNGVEPLLKSLRGIDFYFLTLPELKQKLINAVQLVNPVKIS